MASQYEEGELLELPLKFNDIVDVYYDKMRPPKSEGKKKFSCFCQDFKHQREFVSSKLGYWMMESEENLKKINYSVKFNVEIENIGCLKRESEKSFDFEPIFQHNSYCVFSHLLLTRIFRLTTIGYMSNSFCSK